MSTFYTIDVGFDPREPSTPYPDTSKFNGVTVSDTEMNYILHPDETYGKQLQHGQFGGYILPAQPFRPNTSSAAQGYTAVRNATGWDTEFETTLPELIELAKTAAQGGTNPDANTLGHIELIWHDDNPSTGNLMKIIVDTVEGKTSLLTEDE